MNFTDIHDIRLFLAMSMQQDWTEVSWRHNVYNANFSLKARLEHGFAIEYT